jgi:hypothetical protein
MVANDVRPLAFARKVRRRLVQIVAVLSIIADHAIGVVHPPRLACSCKEPTGTSGRTWRLLVGGRFPIPLVE